MEDCSTPPLAFVSPLRLSLHKPITIARPLKLPPAGLRCCSPFQRETRRCSPVRCRPFLLPFPPPWYNGPFQRHVIVSNTGQDPARRKDGRGEVAASTSMYGSSNDRDGYGLEDQAPTDMPPNLDNGYIWGVRMSNGAPARDGAIDTAADEEDVETTSDSDRATRTAASRKANGGRMRVKWGIDVDLEVNRITSCINFLRHIGCI